LPAPANLLIENQLVVKFLPAKLRLIGIFVPPFFRENREIQKYKPLRGALHTSDTM